MYKAKEKIVVLDDRLYDLQALKSAEFKKRDANAFLYVYSGLKCFTLKEPGALGGNERKPEDYQNMQYTQPLSKPVA